MKLFKLLMQLPRNVKRGIGLVIDIGSITVAMVLAYLLSFDAIVPLLWSQWIILGGVVLGITLLAFIRFGLYRAVVRYVGFKVLSLVFFSVIFSGVLLVAGAWVMGISLPVSAVVNYVLIAFLLTGGSRLVVREGYQRVMSRQKDRVIIYGAGSAGRQLAQAISNGDEFHPVLFVDDDSGLQNTSVLGLKVISPEHIESAIRDLDIQRILLALPSTLRSRRRQILDALEALPVKVQTVPGMADMVNGDLSIDQLQDVRVEDLLGRDPVTPAPQLMEKHITGQTVLVTGAGGSIGSELCRQILQQRPKVLVLYELSEFVLLHPGQLESKLQIIGLDWPAWWNPVNWSREMQLSESEIQAIENFSVRAANCERPADRQHILAELRRSWGSEAAFDAFVREEMKAMLLSGKKRYMSTAPRAVQEAISFLFSSMG